MKRLIVLICLTLIVGCGQQLEQKEEAFKESVFLNNNIEIVGIEFKGDKVNVSVKKINQQLTSIKELATNNNLEEADAIVALFKRINYDTQKHFKKDLGVLKSNNAVYTYHNTPFVYISNGEGIFAVSKSDANHFKKNSNAKDKNDYYKMNPGDSEWESVVDSLFDILGDD